MLALTNPVQVGLV